MKCWSLLLTYHNSLDGGRQFVPFAVCKAGIAKHSLKFRVSVGIAARGPPKHHQTESRGLRRRHSIRIGYEFESHCSSAIGERAVDFAQERFASLRVEVMKEVRQKNQVITGTIINIERAALFGVITVRDSGSLRILFGDAPHV